MRERRECSDDNLLLWKCCLRDHGRGSIGWSTGGYEAGEDVLKLTEAHVEHDGLPRSTELLPVDRRAGLTRVAGHERDCLCVVPVRQRNARVGSGTECRRDSGHESKWNVVLDECLELLAA